MDDTECDKVDCILTFNTHNYDLLRFVDMDKTCLHLIYKMCESMIQKVNMSYTSVVKIFRYNQSNGQFRTKGS